MRDDTGRSTATGLAGDDGIGLTRAERLSILIGASVMLSLAMGMRQSFGLLMGPITRDLGIGAADFTFAVAIQNIVWGVTQPFCGALADRYGCRAVAMIGTVLYAAGIALMAVAHGPMELVMGGGVLVGIALSCTASSIAMSASARTVGATKRSMVLGIVSATGSLGTFVAAPLAQGLIAADGWRVALAAFVGLAAAMLPAAFLTGRIDRLPPPPVEDGAGDLRDTLRQASRHGGYITMTLAFFVCGLQLVFLTNHLPTYLADCGFDPMLGAETLAVIGVFNIAGSYLFGWLGGRYPKQQLLGLIYILRSVLIAAYFALPVSTASTLLFAAILGLLWLGVVPLVNGLVAQIFGLRYMATLTGISFLSHQVGSFLGAWGGGWIYDRLGSYDLAWKLGVSIGVVAGLVQILTTVRPLPRAAAVAAAS